MRIGQHLSSLFVGGAGGVHTGGSRTSLRASGLFGQSTTTSLFQFTPVARDSLATSLAITAPSHSQASQTQTIGRVSALVHSIRQLAGESPVDETERSSLQARVDSILSEVAGLAGDTLRLGGAENALIEGVNEAQIARTQVISLSPTGQLTVVGQVTQAAEAARIAIVGTSDKRFADAGEFVLTGNAGAATIQIADGDSLADVAQRINQSAGVTGARAVVSGSALVITSREVGSGATLRFEQVSAIDANSTYVQNVSGVNTSQVAGFTVNSLVDGQSESITGSVTSTAEQGEVRYVGSAGAVTGSATFRLTGSDGHADFSITSGEALSDVADRINAATGGTGVSASVVGDEIILQSAGFGSSAFVQVEVLSQEEHVEVTGVNASQVAVLDVTSILSGGSETISGQVVQAAATAELTIRLGTGGVDANASFDIDGDLSSASISVTEGESIADVVTRINDQSVTTGVSATLSGDDIVLNSSATGAAATIAVTLTDIEYEAVVRGVNASQVAVLDVTSIVDGASETITGQVVQSAETAELTLRLGTGAVDANGTFDLDGDLGTASISFSEGEAFSAVVARINDESASTGVSAALSGDDILLTSAATGDAASLAVTLTDIDYDTNVSGINASQVAVFDVTSLTEGASETITGQVIQSADVAELTLRLGTGAVDANGTFDLDGDLGTASISFVEGEAFSNVVARINAESANTGVSATLSGDDILLTSVDTGDNASIALTLTDIDYEIVVSGDNDQQLENFQVLSFTEGASQTLTGSITQAADNARLTYTGVATVTNSATFEITGNLGTETISVSFLESVNSVASKINATTSTTGVQATVRAGILRIESTGLGSDATIEINVTSGSFNVTGGNGDGTANGVHAEALINGQAITANIHDFSFSDAVGSYSFTVADGFTGMFDSVTIDSVAGQFDAIGGNGDGTANGQDAIADLNGQQYNSAHNSFTLTTANGSFDIEFVDGFTGTFDNITVDSVAGQFDTVGGNGDGTANGQDAIADLNGQQYNSADNSFTLTTANGSFDIEFVDDFTGAFDTITVDSVAGQFDTVGGNGDGTANGQDAIADLNGQQYNSADNSFTLTTANGSFDIEFVSGFTGTLDNITVDSILGQFDLTGADENGRDDGADAVAVINGTQVTGDVNQFTLALAGGTFDIEFASGFTGAFDDITATSSRVTETTSDLTLRTAGGRDAEALINNQSVVAAGNTFTFAADGVEVELQFTDGFLGAFDPVSISSSVATEPSSGDAEDETLQEVLALLAPFASGGELSVGVASSDEVHAATAAAISLLASAVEPDEAPVVRNLSITQPTSQQTARAALIAEQFQAIAKTNPQSILASVNTELLDVRRTLIAGLLGPLS